MQCHQKLSIACKVFLVYVLSDGKRKDNIAAIRRAGKDLFNTIQSSFLIRACNWLHLIFPASLYGIYQQAHVFVCMARVQILCELAITYGEVTKQTKRHAMQMALSNVTLAKRFQVSQIFSVCKCFLFYSVCLFSFGFVLLTFTCV